MSNTNMGALLSEFRAMRKSVEHKLADHEGRLQALELRGKVHSVSLQRFNKTVDLQKTQIDELTKRVDALTSTNAVVWQDNSRVALDRQRVCDEAEALGIPYRTALEVLDQAKKLRRSGDNGRGYAVRTCPVRTKNGVVRAVVIYRD